MIAVAATAITLFLLVLAASSLRPSSRWSVPGGIGSRQVAAANRPDARGALDGVRELSLMLAGAQLGIFGVQAEERREVAGQERLVGLAHQRSVDVFHVDQPDPPSHQLDADARWTSPGEPSPVLGTGSRVPAYRVRGEAAGPREPDPVTCL